MAPTCAFASEGDAVNLKFQGSDFALLGVALALGVVAILVAIGLARWVLAQSPGDEKMQEVGHAIRDGAIAYLKQQIGTMVGFVVALAIGLFLLNMGDSVGTGVGVAVAFVLGVVGSYVAGATGMVIAVNGNMRTAHAALTSYKKSLETAFRSGSVAGLMTVGIGLVGASIILMAGGAHATKYLIGFGFGGSLAALFMRVGGGIFTKAADVGADLVGKVEAGIPEDDPRNPAVIADNVGDNVGDCAGMAADVFESYEVTLVSAIVLAAATSSLLDEKVWIKLVTFALIICGIGVFASVIGIFMVKGNDDLDSDPLKAIRRGFVTSALLAAILVGVASFALMGGTSPLTSDRLENVDTVRRTDATMLQKLREEVAKHTTTPAVLDTVKADVAKKYNLTVDKVTARDIYADPSNIPAALLGVPRMAVENLMAKSTEPVTAQQVTASDLFNTKELKDLGYGADSIPLIQQIISLPVDQLPPVKSLSEFRRVDLKDTTIPELDYGVNTPATPNGPAPTTPYISLRDVYSKTGESAVVFGKLHIKADVPAQPAQNGQPAQLAQKVDNTNWIGPIEKKQFEDSLKASEERFKAQGITVKYEIEDTKPAVLLMNPKTREFAVGVPKEVPRPYSLKESGGGRYYKKSAAELNTAAKAAPGAPPSAEQGEMDFGTLDSKSIPWWGFMLATWVGIGLAFVIERLTEYYVSTHKKPTQEVAGVSSGGAATMIIQGFAYGAESAAMMTMAIVAALMAALFIFPFAVYGSYVLALYAIALVGLGLLANTGFVLAMDTFGPISDNAQGVFEMSGAGHANPEAAKAVGRLDAAGNTTKALTKGFAIATAVVAAIALFNSYRGEAMLSEIGLKLDVPEIFLGLLIGGAAPFLFSSFAINAVGRSAFQLINEVRRQFRENPGIMTYETKPDYARCVAIVTAAAQKELLAPGILAIALPAAVAFGFSIGKPLTTIGGVEYNLTGAQALGGFLAGAILSGQLMAVLLSNSGGMWDNAKKLIEDGMYGGKGSEAHKASVVCDTVGDPFKDTAGPALNPLIKVMNLVALLLASTIIKPLSQGVLIGVTIVCVGLLVFSFYLSKKGSFSDDLRKAQEEGNAADDHMQHG